MDLRETTSTQANRLAPIHGVHHARYNTQSEPHASPAELGRASTHRQSVAAAEWRSHEASASRVGPGTALRQRTACAPCCAASGYRCASMGPIHHASDAYLRSFDVALQRCPERYLCGAIQRIHADCSTIEPTNQRHP